MDTHHQAPYSCHVVDVGEADEADCGQVMDEHDQEVLKLKRQRDGQALNFYSESLLCIFYHNTDDVGLFCFRDLFSSTLTRITTGSRSVQWFSSVGGETPPLTEQPVF